MSWMTHVQQETGFGAATRTLWLRGLTELLGMQDKLMEIIWEACSVLFGDWQEEKTFLMNGGQKPDLVEPFPANWFVESCYQGLLRLEFWKMEF